MLSGRFWRESLRSFHRFCQGILLSAKNSFLGVSLPRDITGPSFSEGNAEYADDWVLYGTDPNGLSRALDSLQSVSESIILDVMVKKTKWIYLNNLCTVEMATCAARRQPGPSCEQIKLGGLPIQHSELRIISEIRGVSAETTS